MNTFKTLDEMNNHNDYTATTTSLFASKEIPPTESLDDLPIMLTMQPQRETKSVVVSFDGDGAVVEEMWIGNEKIDMTMEEPKYIPMSSTHFTIIASFSCCWLNVDLMMSQPSTTDCQLVPLFLVSIDCKKMDYFFRVEIQLLQHNNNTDKNNHDYTQIDFNDSRIYHTCGNNIVYGPENNFIVANRQFIDASFFNDKENGFIDENGKMRACFTITIDLNQPVEKETRYLLK